MGDKTGFGDRMKGYEAAEAARRFMPLLPICVRLDGKRFSKWTQGLARPYDERLSRLMVAVTVDLVTQTSAAIGYTQSDEISLVLYSEDPTKRVYHDGRVQKINSVLAASATARYNRLARELLPERAEQPAIFDCRCWAVPTLEEAVNTLLWRELDATKNSVSMAARHYYPHETLHGLDGRAMQELLHQEGVNWNDYPAFFKRGTFVRRRAVTRAFSAEELEALPERHAARSDPDLVVTRHLVEPMEMPPFSKVTNRVGVVFRGEAPGVASPPPAAQEGTLRGP
jgi:tRNA(His) guanylyltransferase